MLERDLAVLFIYLFLGFVFFYLNISFQIIPVPSEKHIAEQTLMVKNIWWC